MEAGKEEKCNKKGKTKKRPTRRYMRGQDGNPQPLSAGRAEAGKEGFRAVGLVRPDLFSTPSPS